MRHLSIQTEKAYVHWIRRFIVYHGKRHPRELDSDDVRQFLTFLATELHVASSETATGRTES
ncbi:MAG: site-specific integrase [Rhodothermia bacterium]